MDSVRRESLTNSMRFDGWDEASRWYGPKVGGVAPVAEIVTVDKASKTRILSTIEGSNPDLAEQIRELMFTFEDLTLIDGKQMQTVLKDVDEPI